MRMVFQSLRETDGGASTSGEGVGETAEVRDIISITAVYVRIITAMIQYLVLLCQKLLWECSVRQILAKERS